MVHLQSFITAEDGAVTVDWVVLTAALVGLGLATMAVVSGGVENLSGDTASELAAVDVGASPFGSSGPSTVDFSGSTSTDYYAYGASLAPGNNGATYYHAQQAAAADAPAGYNFDNPLVDTNTGNVVYTSDDGSSYAVGGNVYSVGDSAVDPVYWGA